MIYIMQTLFFKSIFYTVGQILPIYAELAIPTLNFENIKFGNWHKLAKIGPPGPPPPHN